jgi:hypothetical protein
MYREPEVRAVLDHPSRHEAAGREMPRRQPVQRRSVPTTRDRRPDITWSCPRAISKRSPSIRTQTRPHHEPQTAPGHRPLLHRVYACWDSRRGPRGVGGGEGSRAAISTRIHQQMNLPTRFRCRLRLEMNRT